MSKLAGRRFSFGIIFALIGLFVFSEIASSSAYASSFIFDGPGFKVQKKQGWFGTRSSTYQDALGNNLEQRKGFFGRTTSRTKLFGTEAIKSRNNVQVNDPSGRPIITSHRTIFSGNQTHVDGNGIMQSVRDLFRQ